MREGSKRSKPPLLTPHSPEKSEVPYFANLRTCFELSVREHVSRGDILMVLCVSDRSVGRILHSVYPLIFHTPTDLPLHAGTEDLLLLVDVYYLVWLAGGKP